MELKTLVWNVCGAKKPGFLRAFKHVTRTNEISLAALLETQVSGVTADEICGKTGMHNFRIEAIGRRGGIWILWKDSVSIKIIETNEHFLHTEVCYQNGVPCIFTVVYALPPVSGQEDYWNRLIELAPQGGEPWLVAGDFNAITTIEERKGGSGILRNHDLRFGRWIHRAKLIDLGYVGTPYTWARPQGESGRISKRLDRALCNENWRIQWAEGTVHHLARFQSDHSPLLICFSNKEEGRKGRRPFRFQAAWFSHSNFDKVVQDNWDPHQQLTTALETLKEELKTWNKEVFGHIEGKKRRLLARLKGLQIALDKCPNNGLLELEDRVRAELEQVLEQEELLWLQKSREQWITSGDRNTKFFHTTTIIRRRRNKVLKLRNNAGAWIEDTEGLENLAYDYFKQLYTSEPQEGNSTSIKGLFPSWSSEESEHATRPISVKEVHRAICSMAPLKAPGIDGFHAIFFQKSWNTIKEKVVTFIREAFRTGDFPPSLNETLLVLIPKTTSPETIRQFRPISLCNVAYKILTKVIVNRLKPKLPELISQAQGSFVPGRQISNNVIVLQETIHSMKQKRGIKGWMAIKLDLEKAYDRIRWSFVQESLEDAGIPAQITRLIMHCISSPSLRIMWNGETTKKFTPTRGLRQGDPLSPYLFVICMEKFAHWIETAIQQKKWKPIKLTRQGPSISHLLFADDVILFAEATIEQAKLIKQGLSNFCNLSGQKINEEKSRVFFSKNLSASTSRNISQELGIRRTEDLGKYLGIPMVHQRINSSTFNYILEKAQAKLAGWKAKQLSLAGRVTLTRSVLATLPYYAMQVMCLPRALCDKLDQVNRNFIWGDSEDKRSVHLVKWEDVCRPKNQGGLGIRSTRAANEALMTKLGWRLTVEPESMWAQVLTKKYIKQSSRTSEIVPQAKQSTTWAGLTKIAHTVKENTRWIVGDGNKTRFWIDEWVPNERSFREHGIVAPLDQEGCVVRHYWRTGQGWNWTVIEALLPPEWWPKIASVFVDDSNTVADHPAWKKNGNGEFTTKSVYLSLINTQPRQEDDKKWKTIWCLAIPERIRTFLWLCQKGKLMTNKERCKRKFCPNPCCSSCGDRVESIIHVLRDCPEAQQIWKAIIPQQQQRLFFGLSQLHWLQKNIAIQMEIHEGTPWNITFATTTWWLWKWRNERIFNKRDFKGNKVAFIMLQAKEFITTWKNDRTAYGRNTPKADRNRKWTPPPENWYKINIDGASRGNPGVASCGGVVRDYNGYWCTGFTTRIGISSAITAEVWAIWHGLQLARKMKYRNIIVETDSQLAVSYLTEGINKEHTLFPLVSNSKSLFRNFNRVEVAFCTRECNKVADRLASDSFEGGGRFMELINPPEHCQILLQEDLAADANFPV